MCKSPTLDSTRCANTIQSPRRAVPRHVSPDISSTLGFGDDIFILGQHTHIVAAGKPPRALISAAFPKIV
jgi:hypothetical protein